VEKWDLDMEVAQIMETVINIQEAEMETVVAAAEWDPDIVTVLIMDMGGDPTNFRETIMVAAVPATGELVMKEAAIGVIQTNNT
jgi:hypothetical protein